jgi:imidazolonepropionase-like amidohydrolase
MTGEFMNPYPYGRLGVIEKGANADTLLVDGNPLQDLSVIGTNDKWFDVPEPPESPETIRNITKDGKIFKNSL